MLFSSSPEDTPDPPFSMIAALLIIFLSSIQYVLAAEVWQHTTQKLEWQTPYETSENHPWIGLVATHFLSRSLLIRIN
jgi:hypothetical protein